MSESQGAAGSIVSIVGLGLTLATTLQTYVESQCYPKERLREICYDVNSTAGALRQLHEIIEVDRYILNSSDRLQVLKDEGREEIEIRAAQCEKLYKTIIALLVKAGTAGWKGKQKTASIDTQTLKVTSLTRGLKWLWLEPRIKRSREQLGFLNMNLLLVLQIASLARLQVSTTQRVPGLFEEELALRLLVDRLRKKKLRTAKTLALKHRIVRSTASSSATNLSIIIPIDDSSNKDVPEAQKDSPTESASPESPAARGTATNPPPYSEAANGNKIAPVIEKDEIVEVPVTKPESTIPSPGPRLPPPPPPPTQKAAQLEPTKKQPMTTSAGEVVIDSNHELAKNEAQDIELISMSTFENKFGGVQTWFKEFFGPSNKFFNDKESENLEAFMILGDKKRLKVPFGHRRLKFGLKALMKTKKTSTLDDYYALPKHLHVAISNVMKGAKIKDGRERVCICFDVLSMGDKPMDQHLLAFFLASGSPIKPIHFKDAVGRKFLIPYHLVETWEEMKTMVNQAFLHVDIIGPHVSAGRYDLVGPTSEIILPNAWEGIAKPGASITMHMWPIPDPQPFYRPPPPGPPRPPGAPFPPRPMGLRGPPPPPPAQRPHYPGVVVIDKAPIRKKTPYRPRRRPSYSSFGSDSSELDSDSEIEDEVEDLGIEFDFEKERELAEVSLSELLAKWTNAIDTEGGPLDSTYDSDSSSGSSSLLDD